MYVNLSYVAQFKGCWLQDKDNKKKNNNDDHHYTYISGYLLIID